MCFCLALRMVVRCREHMCWLFLWRTCTPTTSISFGRTCVSASSSRSLQSVFVLLVAQRYRKFDVWSLYGLTTWQQNEILSFWESFPIISRSHPSCHDRSEWGILHWNAQGHQVPREKCLVSISPLELYRKRHWLNRLSSRAQSGTQLLRTKRLHLLILDNLVTKSVELWSCDRNAFEVP